MDIPKEISIPFRPIPLEVPEGMKPNEFLGATKTVRDKCKKDAKYANAVRWQPAFKQLIYRNDKGKLIVTISQNSIGNAITKVLGIVVNRTLNKKAYE